VTPHGDGAPLLKSRVNALRDATRDNGSDAPHQGGVDASHERGVDASHQRGIRRRVEDWPNSHAEAGRQGPRSRSVTSRSAKP